MSTLIPTPDAPAMPLPGAQAPIGMWSVITKGKVLAVNQQHRLIVLMDDSAPKGMIWLALYEEIRPDKFVMVERRNLDMRDYLPNIADLWAEQMIADRAERSVTRFRSAGGCVV
jgi:hypothetical protein